MSKLNPNTPSPAKRNLMQRYSMVHPLYLSFFSRSLYQDVARNWKGLCMTYLIALLALSVIPGVMTVRTELTAFLNTEAPLYVKQFPTITITDGKVSVNKPEPYYIKNEKTGKPAIIIDTTGKVTSLKDSPAVILITKTGIMVKSGSATRDLDFSGIKNLVVDRRVIYGWMDSFQTWFPFLFYPIALLSSFLYHLVEVAFYSVIGLMFSRSLRSHLRFRTIVRLAVVAMTPSVVLGVLAAVSGLNVPYWWYISLLISTAYVYFAVQANSGRETPVAA